MPPWKYDGKCPTCIQATVGRETFKAFVIGWASLLRRSPSGFFIELNAGLLDLIEIFRRPNPYATKGYAKAQAELR